METCDAVLWEGGDSYECVLSAGHRAEHYDDEGHWWPTQDQLATW